MYFVGVDLGTTNIKVILYNEKMETLSVSNEPVTYDRNGNFVEFDAEGYFQGLAKTIGNCCAQYFDTKPYPVAQIVLTGQAESLIVLGKNERPLRKGISWLDMRSSEECEELAAQFDQDTCYHITGQTDIIPTWPVTKILWLKHHEKESFDNAWKYILLKDYMQFRMCGVLAGDQSIYTFTHYYNIVEKHFWKEILDYVGVRADQVPDTVPSCTVIGTATEEFMQLAGVSAETKVNVGTLDHFAGMIGVGNIHEGAISESTGTVLALATLLDQPMFSEEKVALHTGPFPGTYCLLPVCESGGCSLEWFKRNCMGDTGYDEMNAVLAEREKPGKLVFIPYVTGGNAPDNNMDASGVFFGLRMETDKFDMAMAVMEGVAQMLNSNIEAMSKANISVDHIISTGGGSKSEIWCQMKADITGKKVMIPKDKEAACLGAAIIGAVSEGVYASFDEAVDQVVVMEKTYYPEKTTEYAEKVRLYNEIYKSLGKAFKMSPAN